MPRRPKSQWDFGELFPPEATRRVLTVSELTQQVRRLLEEHLGQVWVTGEVTNFRAQASGHAYFTLKDAGAQLNCVLFRGEALAHRDCLEDGRKVLLHGDLTVYEARGQYQLVVRAIEPQGLGALQVAFERLKRKLEAEGLFAPERKRPLPRYPTRLGVVTSPTGAALRDVLHVIRRRHAGLEIVLAPCRVQGAGAAEEIAGAIRLLNEWSQSLPAGQRLDVLLLTRGGGSLEDLWAFNEEVVARAIFESALPVVSAVGHEIDFTISDFVADLRAATPSAAAELLTEGYVASRAAIEAAAGHLRRLVLGRLEQEARALGHLGHRLAQAHPRRRLEECLQRLDDAQVALFRCARQGWRESRTRWQHLRQRLAALKPSALLARRRQDLHDLARHLLERATRRTRERRHALALLADRLRLLSPDNVLARGYSITTDAASNAILRAAAATHPGQRLKTRLRSGEVHSIVEG
jgi:exodeoxyribonuclease VII large subunit